MREKRIEDFIDDLTKISKKKKNIQKWFADRCDNGDLEVIIDGYSKDFKEYKIYIHYKDLAIYYYTEYGYILYKLENGLWDRLQVAEKLKDKIQEQAYNNYLLYYKN